MIVWIDAQLSPGIAIWIADNFPIRAIAIRDLGLREATDREIFDSARQHKAVVMTKDSDFVELINRYGPPPQVIWLTFGNTSNTRLREILSKTLKQAMDLLHAGESLVEIGPA